MRSVVDVFARLTRVLHYVSGGLILAMMFVTVANIVGRGFGRTVRGTIELTEIAMVAIVFLGLAYAQVREDHISVDIVYERLGPRGRQACSLFAAFVSFVTIAFVSWRLWDYSGVLEASGRTTSSLSIPLYYVAWLAAIGAATYLVGIAVTAFHQFDPDQDTGTDLLELEGVEAADSEQ